MTTRVSDFEYGSNHPRIEVVDSTRRNNLPTGHVHVRYTGVRPSDAALALAAGYTPTRHFGYNVEHHDDNLATVHLHND